MRLPFLWLAPCLSLPYLVSLKGSETLDTFLQYDLTYPVAQRVKGFVNSAHSIGNFTVMMGDFSQYALERLKRCPLVADITPDVILKAFDEQEDAPRHLARISHRRKLGDDLTYYYDGDAQGSGVNAYVIDSGVEIHHPQFEGRAVHGKDFTGEGTGDANGHGTHVAGLIGSRTYGVAKDVTIVEVKALDARGAGLLSTIILAIEYSVNHRAETDRAGVINLSLGAAKNLLLNQAVLAAVDTGMVVVVAAGNLNLNACNMSPALSRSAITVGAIDDMSDVLAPFTNWGSCVDVFAPGVNVTSVNARGSDPRQLSGTSMAAPIVSGIVACFLSEGMSPWDVEDHVVEVSAKNKISRTSLLLRRGTPNRIANNGYDGSE